MIPPFLMQLAAKYAVYIVATIVLACAYFAWSYHVEQVGYAKAEAKYAKRDAETARRSAELLEVEKANVERENQKQTERLQNAITIYATRTSDLNDDIDNLAKRMRQSTAATSCSKDPMPRSGNDNGKREKRDNEENHDIARAALELANLCEYQINRLEVRK